MCAAAKLEIVENNQKMPLIKWLKRSVLAVAVLSVMILTAYLAIPLLLEWYMVDETPVHPVDVIFTGVGLGSALDSTVDLYKTGMVKQIVVTYKKERIIEQEGKPVALHELTVQQLIQKGVPQEAVSLAQWDIQDRIERRLAFRNWIHEHNIKSYISFSSRYHSRFAQIIHNNTFPEGDVELVLLIYTSNRLWRKQMLNLHNSIIRMVYWDWVVAPELHKRIEQIRNHGNME